MLPTSEFTAPSFVSGTSVQPLRYLTLDGVLKAALRAVPRAEALVVPYQSLRYTYADLDRQVERVARGLIACGLFK